MALQFYLVSSRKIQWIDETGGTKPEGSGSGRRGLCMNIRT